MKLFSYLVFFTLSSSIGLSLSISSSGEEVRYEYETTFRSLKTSASLSQEVLLKEADFHAIHLFGIFHSPEVAETHGLIPELIEGFAGTKFPKIKSARYFAVDEDPYLWITYRAEGTFILHKKVLKDWLGDKKTGTVELPLLKDFPALYKDDMSNYRQAKWKKCTDSHYWEPENFSYFYTPYKCEELGKSPLAEETEFRLERVNERSVEPQAKVPVAELHGANGNGNLITFYFISGFDGSPAADPKQIHKDEGWKTFAGFEKLLVKGHGFEKIESLAALRETLGDDFDRISIESPVSLVHDQQRRYFSTFVKTVGEKTYVARSALFNTENEVSAHPLRSFPKFWKEAWENADVIYFGGHSGDGKALNLTNVLDTLKKSDVDNIKFNPEKTQIALLDSCSSYAHYQETYSSRKPARLHLITTGLVSLFYMAESTIEELVKLTFTENAKSMTWVEALHHIEKNQLPAHVKASYLVKDQEEALQYFKKKRQYPSSLLSVRLSE